MKQQLTTSILTTIVSSLLLCLAVLPLQAAEPRVLDAPLSVPESLLKKFDTAHLPEHSNAGLVRYLAKQDAELLRQWLRSEGYLDAKTGVEMDENGAIWRVVAGPLWHVRHIDISPAPPKQEQLIHKQLIQAGAPFRSADYETAKSGLLWSWRDAGFLQAEYTKAVALPDRTSHEVDIVWHIKPGAMFTISDIRIDGARQYDAALAIKLSRLQPGQVASRQRLRHAMRYITEDSRYQHAIVIPEVKQAAGNRVPVRITVRETAWRKLTGDMGYSTDNGFTLGANWVDRSIFSGHLETQLRGQISRTNANAGITLLRPAWPAANHQLGISLDYDHVDSDGRRYNAIRGGPFWQWNFRGDDYLLLTLHNEQIRESGISLTTVGPRADIHFSHTSNQLLPTRGWRADLALDLPLRLGSPGLWPYLDLSGRYFYQPWQWLLISPRAGFGRTLNLQGSVPKSFRQFAGGYASARGYALDSLGATGTDGLATGGLMKGFGGIDLILMPEAQYVSPVIFSDLAKLWQTVGTSATTAWSIGGGIILHTPAGPLRIDLSFPQNRRPQDASFQLYISLGEVL